MDGGVRLLNPPNSLLAAHDKFLTAQLLRAAALPHPRTVLVRRRHQAPDIDFPAVLKPRFGSWGRDVVLCQDRSEFEHSLETIASLRGSPERALSSRS